MRAHAASFLFALASVSGTVAACSSSESAGSSDASPRDDASSPADTGVARPDRCSCGAPRLGLPGCPSIMNATGLLGEPCSSPGLVCEYLDDVAPCTCGDRVRCDPVDAGASDGGDGGDGGAAYAWTYLGKVK